MSAESRLKERIVIMEKLLRGFKLKNTEMQIFFACNQKKFWEYKHLQNFLIIICMFLIIFIVAIIKHYGEKIIYIYK